MKSKLFGCFDRDKRVRVRCREAKLVTTQQFPLIDCRPYFGQRGVKAAVRGKGLIRTTRFQHLGGHLLILGGSKVLSVYDRFNKAMNQFY